MSAIIYWQNPCKLPMSFRCIKAYMPAFSGRFSRKCLEGISFKFFVCFIFNVSIGSAPKRKNYCHVIVCISNFVNHKLFSTSSKKKRTGGRERPNLATQPSGPTNSPLCTTARLKPPPSNFCLQGK